VASTSDPSLVPQIIRATDTESLDFVSSPVRRSHHRHVTASARYDKHDVIADLGGPAKPVIPTPLSVRRPDPESWVDIGTRWTVMYQPQLEHEAKLLAGECQTPSILMIFLIIN